MSLAKKLVACLALVFAFTTSVAHADTPVATGSVRYANDSAFATWEAFEVSSNTFGFFLRVTLSNGHILTVTPFETAADGSLSLWFIEYQLIGATNPDGTQGWQWNEIAGGRVSLVPPSGGGSPSGFAIDGTMAWTWQKVGYQRVDITTPQPFGVRFTMP